MFVLGGVQRLPLGRLGLGSRCGALLLSIFVLACVPAEESGSGAPDRIVLIVIDTLRADALPFHGADTGAAPFLAELAQQSLVFERAWSASSWTAPSAASIFTSRYPNQHGVIFGLRGRLMEGRLIESEIRAIPDSIETIPSFLQAQGYETFGASANLNVGPKLGFERGFGRFQLLKYRAGFDGLRVTERVLKWKPQLEAADRSFLYIHYMDPHPPNRRHAEEAPTDLPAVKPSLEDRDAYASEIRLVDEALRRLFDELDLMDAVVFVTSDHGQEFRDHGGLGHGFQLYSELTHVPLLLHLPGPGAPRGRVAHDVSNLDILPTLRFLLGTPPSAADAGRSLLPLSEPGPTREIFAMRSHDEAGVREHKRAVIRGRHKLIVTEPQGSAELYDLYSDPRESVDLAAELAETRERLRALLAVQSQSADPALHGPADVYLPSEAEARLLEELGYVEGAD